MVLTWSQVNRLARRTVFSSFCPTVHPDTLALSNCLRGKADSVPLHSRLLSIGFNVAGEIVENGLPPFLLLLDGVRGFAVKGDADDHAFGVRGELDLRYAIAERILDQLMLDDLRVSPGEIEAHAAV